MFDETNKDVVVDESKEELKFGVKKEAVALSVRKSPMSIPILPRRLLIQSGIATFIATGSFKIVGFCPTNLSGDAVVVTSGLLRFFLLILRFSSFDLKILLFVEFSNSAAALRMA